MASEPLLNGQDTGTDTLLEAQYLSEEQPDFVQVIAHDPEGVIAYIEQKGVQDLGTFKVQDETVLELLEDGAMFTLGSDSQYPDWERMWKQELSRDDTNKPKGWTAHIEVQASVVTLRNAANADDFGLLNPILHRYMNGACSLKVWGLQAVRAVVTFKWNAWARYYLYCELACYLIWLLGFQVFTIIFQDEDSHESLRQLLKHGLGRATVAAELVCLCGMAPFLYIEAGTFLEYGFYGWRSAWNFMDVVAYVNQIVIAVMHLGRYAVGSEALSVLVSFQILLLWVKIQYFARVLQPTKNPFMDTLRAVIQDVKWFLFLLVLTVWGFTCAFYILFRQDQQYEQFNNILHAFVTLFSIMLGGTDLDLFYNSHNPIIGIVLLLLFVFTMSMVLLNCLIAIMSDACSRVAENGDLRFTAGRAQIIDELECTIPAWLRRCNPQWYPKFVHVLTVVPSGCLAVFTEDDTAAAAAAAKPDPLEQMQATISELQQQLQAMAKTQEAMAKCVLGKQSGTDEQTPGVPTQSESEATSLSEPKSEPTEGSGRSWLPSMPSILGRTQV
ncbi:hypothetical protein ABBQ32_004434 [Trebouxia sp. C0010 RCD-2024]